jgi:hypothetical protein
MKRIFWFLLLPLLSSALSHAQDFSVRTNDISLDFKKPVVGVKGLPIINWKSPSLESSISPFPSFIIEALVSSDVELKSVSLIFSNGSVVIGEKSHDVKGLKEKKIRQKLTLNDGRNVVEIVVENNNGDKVTSKRTLIIGEYVPDKNDGVAFAGSGNKLMVKRMEIENDKLNLYYDLVDSVSTHSYAVDVYSSLDNFLSKQEKVSGDIGLEIKPGTDHKITWNAKEVLGAAFNGKFRLELRAKLSAPFVQFDAMRRSYKRGKDFSIKWKSDPKVSILNFDLFKGDRLVYQFANISNEGQATLRIPASVKPGSGYYLKISDINNKDQMALTKQFSVKRKTPLLLKVLPVALVGGAAAALGGGGSSNGTHTIPDPLSPTTIH